MSNNNSDIDSSSNNTIDNPIQQYSHVDISTAKDLKGRSSSPRFSDISNNSVSSSGSGSSSSGVSIKSLRIDDDETQRQSTRQSMHIRYGSDRSSLRESSIKVARDILALLCLTDKRFDINTYKQFLKFSMFIMTLNVLIYIGINISVLVLAAETELTDDKESPVKLRVQLGFFVLGAFFELFCLFRSRRLFYKMTESNAIYALTSSAAYVLILICAIIDGIFIQKNILLKYVVNSTVLGIFLAGAAILLIWQCYTCFILFKLLQFIKFNYDDDSDRDRDSINSRNSESGLNIPLTVA